MQLYYLKENILSQQMLINENNNKTKSMQLQIDQKQAQLNQQKEYIQKNQYLLHSISLIQQLNHLKRQSRKTHIVKKITDQTYQLLQLQKSKKHTQIQPTNNSQVNKLLKQNDDQNNINVNINNIKNNICSQINTLNQMYKAQQSQQAQKEQFIDVQQFKTTLTITSSNTEDQKDQQSRLQTKTVEDFKKQFNQFYLAAPEMILGQNPNIEQLSNQFHGWSIQQLTSNQQLHELFKQEQITNESIRQLLIKKERIVLQKYRKQVWQYLISNELKINSVLEMNLNKKRKINANYKSFTQISQFLLIEFDLHRTFPSNKYFNLGTHLSISLQILLQKFAMFAPHIGYVQGMAYPASIILVIFGHQSFKYFTNLIMTNQFLTNLYKFKQNKVLSVHRLKCICLLSDII